MTVKWSCNLEGKNTHPLFPLEIARPTRGLADSTRPCRFFASRRDKENTFFVATPVVEVQAEETRSSPEKRSGKEYNLSGWCTSSPKI